MGSFTAREFRLKTGEIVIVRSAAPDNARAVLAHGKAVVDEVEFNVTCPEEYTFTEEQERDWLRSYSADADKLVIGAEASGQFIGVLFLESRSRKRLAHVATLHMSVRKDWRSRGLGTVLLQSAIESA